MLKQKILIVAACLASFVIGLTAVFLLISDDRVAETVSTAQSGVTVVIDAGHGGSDGGAVSENGTVEAVVNLDIAKKTELLLAFFGVRTKMTRTTDEIEYSAASSTIRAQKNEDQKRRIALVNGTQNAVLLSIHQNTYPAPSPHGAQVLHARDPVSSEWAAETQGLLVSQLDASNKRVSEPIAPEILLFKSISCPAILVECGFISNPAEEALLNTQSYRLKTATVIAAGFLCRRMELEAYYTQPGAG